MNTSPNPFGRNLRVLVCGASFAGLTMAYWMNSLGYDVTIVEICPTLKKGGSPVDIKGATIDIVKRMRLYEEIRSRSLKPKRTEFKNADGRTVALLNGEARSEGGDEEYEIERDELLDLMFETVKRDVRFIFGDRVAEIAQTETQVAVRLASGAKHVFDLLLGCDGSHSSIRRLVFGPEADYAVFLQNYFAISIVDELLIDQGTTRIYNVPGKTLMLNAYNNKTDIAFCFFSQDEIAYDHHDQAGQRHLVHRQFAEENWCPKELLHAALDSRNFYFDKFSQIRMPSWSKGRVALVGDAAYCPTPAAGMGGSLAIIGATALADAFVECEGRVEEAFQAYDRSLRPVVEEVQADAVAFGLEMFVPRTQAAIDRRNARFLHP